MTGRKNKKTYEKVAETFKNKGDSAWHRAKSGDGDHHYDAAKRFYDTSERAKKKAEDF